MPQGLFVRLPCCCRRECGSTMMTHMCSPSVFLTWRETASRMVTSSSMSTQPHCQCRPPEVPASSSFDQASWNLCSGFWIADGSSASAGLYCNIAVRCVRAGCPQAQLAEIMAFSATSTCMSSSRLNSHGARVSNRLKVCSFCQ